ASGLGSGPILYPTPITIIPPSSVDNNSVSPSSADASVSHNSPAPTVIPHRIHPQNSHSMATRGILGIVQPRLHPTLLLTHVEPTCYKQALQHPKWLAAMKSEYDALMTNNTWS
ncbi:histone deacetylase, partial [Trifolium medium]|nr:histone deacetylase [Trifolium medium]